MKLMSSCLLLLLIASAAAKAQQPVEELQKQFAAYQQFAVQEKLFVHTDKNFYLTGETIWFKLYQADAGTHKASDLSKVAYVEILNHESKPVLQVKVGLGTTNGSGSGSFLLPAHISSGNYMLRAYTQWMRNFNEAYYFQKPLSIVNTSRRPDWLSLEKREAYKVQFFPEGGNLVYGLQSKVGFKITDQYGKSVEGNGAIVSQRGDTVTQFQSFKFGIGNFYFQPQTGVEYKAVVRINNGKIVSAVLPAIYREGYVMNVRELDKDRLAVTIASVGMNVGSVYLIGHTRQQMKIALAQQLRNGSAEWVVTKDQLGDGITHLTVFNEGRQPVCERLYFKRPSGKMSIDCSTAQAEFNTRSEVRLNLSTQNEKAQPVKGELSMSVFLVDSLQAPEGNTIDSYLWLTSDLNSAIESPSYYFSDASEEVNKAVDNLMLTHGWRRFRWEDVKGRPVFNFVPEYEGLTVHAKVIDKRTGAPAPGIVSYLTVVDEDFQLSNAISNNKGEAAFVLGNVFGPNEMVVQADSNSNRYRVDLTDPFAPVIDSLMLPRFTLQDTWKEQLNARHLNARIMNSYQPVHVQQFFPPPTHDTAVFFGKPDRKFFLDDFTRFPTMEEVMREFVDAVRIRKERDGFRYDVLNVPAKLYFNADPLVLLDGVPVFDLKKIVAFDPLKVKKIDVVGRKYFWGNLIANGIVSYTTYDGDLGGFELDPAAVVVEFQGLQLMREFYQPDYSTPDKKNSRVPDARNVLLWEPTLVPDANGKLQSSFYTSDVPGKYVVVIQGMSSEGKPGSKMITINVKE